MKPSRASGDGGRGTSRPNRAKGREHLEIAAVRAHGEEDVSAAGVEVVGVRVADEGDPPIVEEGRNPGVRIEAGIAHPGGDE